jgi:hypothetical protein
MITYNKTYFVLSILLLAVEIFIALYVHDQIIRPYLGDVLVVILLYCFVKSFFNLPDIHTAVAVLFFSYLIETLQHFNIVKRLGLENSSLANTVIGNYFTWIDILAYTLGFLIVFGLEKILSRNSKTLNQSNNNRWLFL